MAMVRIDKLLADMNIGTRSEVKTYIKKGFVACNEETVKTPERKVDIDKDSVFFQGIPVHYEKLVYFILNKPQGVVSATTDNTCKTVIDLLEKEGRKDLFPVGRLDKDTEGLLIITNDGELSHNLLSPKKHVSKTYFAMVQGMVTKEDILLFESGLDIGDDVLTMPAKLQIINRKEENDITHILLTIQEGRFHQVKRMFEAVGKKVVFLKRIAMGKLNLPPDLETGTYRRLTKMELSLLKGENGNCDTDF